MATLYDDISLGYHACGGSKVGKLYSFKPTDGSGDFAVTRAGTTAFTQTPSGYWKPAAANEPRFTYTNGVRGLLVENAATRLNTHPFSFENNAWTKLGVIVEGDPDTAVSELVTNGGASGNADWVDTNSDGLADNFTYGSNTGAAVFSIVNGNGFSNNAQRVQLTQSGQLNDFRQISSYNAVIGKLYRISFKYRSNVGIKISQPGYGLISPTIPINNGDCVIYKFYYIQTQNTNNIGIYITGGNGSFYEIDEFSIKEVTGFSGVFTDANGVNLKNAYKLVATSDNGSIKLATPVTTVAATSYVNSVYIKRLVGNGTIYLVDVNNTDRTVTVTSEWTRVQYAAAAAGTTGQLGIKMATAGDEVMVCYMPIEAGTSATSPIGGAEGATQTRNADVDTVNVPAGVTQIILTNMNDVETIVTSFSSPYQIPVGTWKSIIMK